MLNNALPLLERRRGLLLAGTGAAAFGLLLLRGCAAANRICFASSESYRLMEITMQFAPRTILSILALGASVSLAQAQTDQNHQSYHPAGQDPAQADPSTLPDQPPQGGMQGMMGEGMPMMGDMMGQGGMGGMMSMMQGMMGQQGQGRSMGMSCPMMAQGGMSGIGMPFEHIEGRIAFLEAELAITDDQQDEWGPFAEALRANAEAMRMMHEHMMQGEEAASFAESLDHREKVLTARLEAVKSLNAAADPLFSTLSEEQKEVANDLLGASTGMM